MVLDNARTVAIAFGGMEAVSCEALRGVKVPTLLVHGERTPESFVKTNDAIARCIAGSRSVKIPNASHVRSYENPAAFNQALLEFIGKRQ
jgi:pimeloyl-ACP methyl ester carboxylesterase